MTDVTNGFKILIVDDEEEYREVLHMILSEEGYITEVCNNGEDALKKLETSTFDLVLTDLMLGGMNGIQLLKAIKSKYKSLDVIIITGYGSIENAVKAIKEGAFTYIIKGHDPEEFLIEIKKIKKIKELENENQILKSQIKNLNFMLETNNSTYKNIIHIAKKAALSNSNILILGESGVGKEVLARYIHNHSNRRKDLFMAVNCHSFSHSILESELFGHEKGAFTGATQRRRGRFEAANGSTLFLDEVGDMPLSTQVKLLRVIETKTIERMGSNQTIDVDFRLISATNQNLNKSIPEGSFRDDLFYRISTITIEIPPLRERKEDLKLYIDFFLKKSQGELKKEIHTIETDVMNFLLSYNYPGNVRELKNIIERLVVLSENGVIRKCDLPEVKKFFANTLDIDPIKPLKDIRREIESQYIEKVLESCGYNISEAAKLLVISRRQLFNKITEYGLK
ncbi:DNA-binding transcriptional response regulator, NtrC family, contains REC, AAA-type ATPase, and a Fis-type DNA-binding domains [Anaerovirgula multivorans]|uniref:Stage 0 sporulation protein A homolog n=1 Tax=Anaerovirgula multivorans TaxID=312168 RepID=A0A239FWM5_9FIRM|nr:sigma-54 dependent transcriptional regulator [Anaerovirgula multivorans]SNS61437.1 DNA-binding transcriptional response regulator, NtrC family, contains REC, AAA-type ATPase, and a Fis-type DNA-binding domains [Anaerovirgula multivorans]